MIVDFDWINTFKNKLQLKTHVKNDTLNKYWIHFLHEYDMNMGEADRIHVKIPYYVLNKLQLLTDNLCKHSSLKKEYTLQGKVAEYSIAYLVNSLFHFFALKKKIDVNQDAFIYGGDGGGDFFIGNHILDVKYRDESPNHGLYLDKSFLDKNDPKNIIIHTTNCISIKLGDLYKYSNQTMILSINGWTSISDFKMHAADKSQDRWRMDTGFLPIKKLLVQLLNEQIAFENNIS